MRSSFHRWISRPLIAGAAALVLTGLPLANPAAASRRAPSDTSDPSKDFQAEFESRAADIWGSGNVWMSDRKNWVQYEADLGERRRVDFENGVACVQILIKATDDPNREQVLAHLRQGVDYLARTEYIDPMADMARHQRQWQCDIRESGSPATLPPGKEIRVYLVRRGDSLWKIARRFRMTRQALASLNGLDESAILPVGRPLKVVVFASHDLTLDAKPRSSADEPILLDQIRMVDGRPVPPWMIKGFAAEVVSQKPVTTEKVVGTDGIERLAVCVDFKLVPNHLEIRARKFHPLVRSCARKYELDPALIMAIIHTESMFNPRARSQAPAYGLMQVVPHTAGQEAYHNLYGRKGNLTSQYLYDPKNNIELGATYFNILKNRYMGAITDPASRTYCAVAAYNAGAANVGRAFVAKKSINQATPVINRLDAEGVYARLIAALPFKESRNYVRKVFNRIRLYREW